MTRSDLSLTKTALIAVCWEELTRGGIYCLGVEEGKGGLDHSWGWDRWWAGGSEPQSCWGALWDWLQGAECGGGKGSEVWGSPQKGAPTLGETRKGGSHPLTSLGIPAAPSPQGMVE